MNKYFRHLAVIASYLYIGIVCAVPADFDSADIPQLEQQAQHAKVTKRVSDLFSRSHYKYIPLNDALSQQVFERYIEQLDYNKQIFMQSDINDLKSYQFLLDDNLKTGQLQPAYEIYQLSLKRRYERFSYALSLLDKEIMFDTTDEFQFDRSKAPWAKDTVELNKIWQQKVKSDALVLKLSGKTWDKIKELLSKRYNYALKHLTQTESEDVFQTFMNAYARTIEPHTSYLSPRNAERFKMEMNLSLEGIGAVLQLEDDYTVIRSLVPGGPAERSNQIFKNDKIIGVGQEDGKVVDVVGWRLDDIVDLIKGPKGTDVKLQILSGKAGDKSKIVIITREQIHLEDREAKSSVEVIDGQKIGVITIPSFYMNLSEDVDQELALLAKENIKGIIIDLRNNGGGALSEATLLTGLFIGTGPVVQVRDGRNQVLVHQDENKAVSYKGPLTVLINRNSASASEIFAAALQDYGRAIILGEQSFGKGTVQQHRRISRFYDKDADLVGSVQYTIAKFYRIDGGSTQNKGVIPDIQFPSGIDPNETGESLEKNALPWDNIKSADYSPVNNLQSVVKSLTEKHNLRIKNKIEFSYLEKDIEEYLQEKDMTTISLKESDRIKLREEQEKESLVRVNERLKRAGLPEVKSVDDIPDDFEPIDSFLLEAAAITLDYAHS
ncbi:C-terminal processing peptidase-1, Serine peptidase, MEROPS family S41A [Psychromonas ingrahamii 37]|uniref:C-terminal processing peptidase-1, Serine peptidase, MEROPS family S41A n=1 Tax=Psychromonas ingrahamii (strain DSM 17664 / CCUG 51855 / 37) TaxID=357804 RepID=A1SWR3_PSYIN|nr:carboxy terminal-processing peptidase [Psychromonas ingrahamii]ABM03928.1 C-terminal processing peptidase-1, Serine peptidase, MEROPS family S41A [Psychromonas ingrahamii 37]